MENNMEGSVQPSAEPQATVASGSTEYAGFWIRLAAAIIDSVALGIIGKIIYDPVAIVPTGNGFSVVGGSMSLRLIVPIIYTLVFWIWLSATPGKLALKLKIVGPDGQKVSPATAVIRYLGYIPSSIVLLIGFIWVGFDKEKQGWHDKIAKTHVVKVK